ncbi:MAG TPA: outer membrane protein assembly factor BamD [Kiritimatiellia bacterium]|nr:outer membrane protein assembly factor BamD [Kiritimatiellia bacterium]HMP35116.1 outer membrane protein assembly factor BamD [Kiritimatiellia bacterium]
MLRMFHPVPRLLLMMVLLALADTAMARSEPYEETGKKHSWFSFNRPAKDNPKDQLAHARELARQDELRKAGRAFRALVMTWPSSREAAAAQWAYAKILEKRDKPRQAFDAYQLLMENYPGQFPDYDAVLQRQFEIARQVMTTRKAKFLFMPGFEAPERAIPLFEKVIQNGPRSVHAPEAQFLIGQAYEQSFQYELAVVAYIATLHRYPLSPFAEPAAFGRARALHAITKDYPNDAQALDEAWAGVMVFLRAYPDSDFAAEARIMRDELLDRKADKLYSIADYYDRIARRPQAARESYEQFARLFPKSERTPEVKRRLQEIDAIKDQPRKQDEDEE